MLNLLPWYSPVYYPSFTFCILTIVWSWPMLLWYLSTSVLFFCLSTFECTTSLVPLLPTGTLHLSRIVDTSNTIICIHWCWVVLWIVIITYNLHFHVFGNFQNSKHPLTFSFFQEFPEWNNCWFQVWVSSKHWKWTKWFQGRFPDWFFDFVRTVVLGQKHLLSIFLRTTGPGFHTFEDARQAIILKVR